jgi:hypothetical protein
MIMQGNTKDKTVIEGYVEMHLYLTSPIISTQITTLKLSAKTNQLC